MVNKKIKMNEKNTDGTFNILHPETTVEQVFNPYTGESILEHFVDTTKKHIEIVETIPSNLEGKSIFFKRQEGTSNTPNKPTIEDLSDTIDTLMLGVGVVPERFSRLVNEIDDTGILQRAIDYAEANNLELKLTSNRTYTLSNTLFFTNIKLDGNNAKLVLTTVDKPILMQRTLLDKSSRIAFSTHISNLIFVGNPAHSKNHGLNIISYWSKYINLEFTNIGGNAIRLSHKHDDGTVLASGTLVENEFHDIIVRRSGLTALWMGDSDNNKITDGVLSNCIIDTNAENAIFIGSGAGWNVRDIHTYSTPNTAISIKNAFNTFVDKIYIEQFKICALNFSSVQRNLTVSNLNIDATKSDDSSICINMDRQLAISQSSASVVFSNVNIFHENTGKQTYVFRMVNPVSIQVANLNRSGSNKAKIFITSNSDKAIYKIMENSAVEGKLADTNSMYLLYEDRQIKQCDYEMFYGNLPKNITFTMPPIWDYSKIVGKVTIDASVNDNGSKTVTWEGRVYLSWKGSNDAISVYVTDVVAPLGFTANPIITADRATHTLKVSFTQSNTNGSGVVTFDYVTCLA